MAENESTQENSEGGAAEQLKDSAGSALDKVKEAGSNGSAAKIIVPAVLAAATAAAGYAAKTRGGPKLKEKGAEKAEDLAQGAASQAEKKGGMTGFAAKALKGSTGGGDGDGGGGVLSGLTQGVTSKLGGGGKDPSTGWGRGRRNPIQRWVDVAVPVEVAYAQWTQFEEFPKFMHRVTQVTQDEEEPQKIHWEEKIWFSKRQWDAEIVDQIPNKRIAWKSVSGSAHTGRVTFHPLAEASSKGEALTRIMVTIDFTPQGMMERMASGMRFVKRATESDLARFKAFIEAHGEPTGTWDGHIEDGEVKKDAKPKEGKPFEESGEQLKPEGAGKDKKPSKGENGKKESKGENGKKESKGENGASSEADGESGDGEGSEEGDSGRRDREQRREERRAKQPA